MTSRVAAFAVAAGVVAAMPLAAQRGQRGQQPPASPRAIAPRDFTGYWVSIVTEDWRWRMVTPAKGDYDSVPLNADGRRTADTWDPKRDEVTLTLEPFAQRVRHLLFVFDDKDGRHPRTPTTLDTRRDARRCRRAAS